MESWQLASSHRKVKHVVLFNLLSKLTVLAHQYVMSMIALCSLLHTYFDVYHHGVFYAQFLYLMSAPTLVWSST